MAILCCGLCLQTIHAQMQFAPPSFEVDGQTATPIDFQKIKATLVFDLDAKRAVAEADVTFRMGSLNAMPVFDLRQDVKEIKLDGKLIEPDLLVTRDPPGLASTPECNQSMQVLKVVLDAQSEHHLLLKYDVSVPHSLDANGPKWKDNGVEWGTWMSELRPGRFLEQWIPANLIFDQFEFELKIKILTQNKLPKHELVTNGTTIKTADGNWTVTFPGHFTAFSPMVILVPSSEIEKSTSKVLLTDGQVVELEVFRSTQDVRVMQGSGKIDPPRLSEIHKATERCLKIYSACFGPWLHGEKCTLFVQGGFAGMEYDGAFTASALLLPHELLHSYIARGLKPASQDDSWIDEAFTIYYLRKEGIEFYMDASRGMIDNNQFDSLYLAKAGQSPLSTRNPWNRITQPGAYQIGVLFFEQIAAIIGEGELDNLMRELIKEYGISKPITTAEFESRLVGVAGPRREDVQKLFSFTVYANTAGDVAELFKDVIAKRGLGK